MWKGPWKGPAKKGDRMTRHQVADLIGLHPDSVSRALIDGLASAVVQWGGRGKLMEFSRRMAERWDAARKCRRRDGKPCQRCAFVLEDAEAVSEHLLDVRHGVFEACPNWDDAVQADDTCCGYDHEPCQPCTWV